LLAAALLIISEGVVVRNAIIVLEGFVNRKAVCQVRGRVGEKIKTRSRAGKKMEFGWLAEKNSLLQAVFPALPVAACKSVFFLCVACIFCIERLSE